MESVKCELADGLLSLLMYYFTTGRTSVSGLFAFEQLLFALFSSKVSSGKAAVSRTSGAGTIFVSVLNHSINFRGWHM